MVQGRSLHLFCARTDLIPVFEEVEAVTRLKYVRCGLFEEEVYDTLISGKEIPNLGNSVTGISISDPFYLVLPADTPVNIRPAPQRAGGVRYEINQGMNPDSITFRPGGMYSRSAMESPVEEVIISGDVSTISGSKVSLDLHKRFGKSIRKRFTHVNWAWLGPEARQLWMNGTRLTQDIRSSKTYDLREDPARPH